MSDRAERLRLLWHTARDQHEMNLGRCIELGWKGAERHRGAIADGEIFQMCQHCQRLADTREDCGTVDE